MSRDSARLAGGRVTEDEIAEMLTAGRMRRFRETDGVKGNPYVLKSLASRLGVHTTTLHGWEVGRSCPGSFAMWRRWAHSVGHKLEITVVDTNGERHSF